MADCVCVLSDTLPQEMSSSYQKFTLPSKEEGPFVTIASYDELTFMWYKEAQSKEYLKKWVLERKMTQRVEDLQPFGCATQTILWLVLSEGLIRV
ncbi:unnamed protein product [Cladocopium goreaui]|uniref:Uncharacterized protein n=1 Tax=Cladocopium goreaui TaxID=2562237 RepID=A0A9P1CK61_9DINO|nr:unnamed protein product [Cladocopium goreaui]